MRLLLPHQRGRQVTYRSVAVINLARRQALPIACARTSTQQTNESEDN
jgi:hypothetical protein